MRSIINQDLLKPCPFCGKQPFAISIEQDELGHMRMRLKCCMDFDIERGETLPISFDTMTPVEKWNRRVKEYDGNK